MRNTAITTKKYIFWLQTAEKVSTALIVSKLLSIIPIPSKERPFSSESNIYNRQEKQQGKHNDQEQREKIRPSEEEVFNQ